MNDLISRQMAIDAIRKDMYADKDYMSAMICDGIESVLRGLPSAQEWEEKMDEWCTDCKEYDQERHCCPRFNRVIRETVEELKAEHRWIPVTERLPEEVKEVYWVCTDAQSQHECRWTNNRYGLGDSDECGWSIFDIPQYTKVVAWMPLPEPYKERTDE